MTLDAYRDQIRLELTGYILDLEIDDSTLNKIIQNSLREIQRYICSTNIITIPFTQCIDLSDEKQTNNQKIKVSSVARVYRADGFSDGTENSTIDPMSASQWQLLSGVGNLWNMQNYVYNFSAWNTLLQMRNTVSTDLLFRYDKATNKLYINISNNTPSQITVEYIPRFDSVDEIISDYWIDQLLKMCIAQTKIIIGRIRTRYSQSNALWTQDGETLLAEGKEELNILRDYLQTNSQLCYPID